jgi:hypothetical protein
MEPNIPPNLVDFIAAETVVLQPKAPWIMERDGSCHELKPNEWPPSTVIVGDRAAAEAMALSGSVLWIAPDGVYQDGERISTPFVPELRPVPLFATAKPPVTSEMLEAGERAWRTVACVAGGDQASADIARYRAMRALEPMHATPGLWSDDTYRVLLAERDALRSEFATLREASADCWARWLRGDAPPSDDGRFATPATSDPLGPHLTALRGLP